MVGVTANRGRPRGEKPRLYRNPPTSVARLFSRRKETRFFALVRARGRAEGEQAFVFRRDGTIQCPKKRRGPILRPTLFLLVTVSCLTVQHQNRRDNEPYYCRNVREREPNMQFHSLAPSLRLCYYLYGVWRVVWSTHRPTSHKSAKGPFRCYRFGLFCYSTRARLPAAMTTSAVNS